MLQAAMSRKGDIQQLREAAWIGDAVLELFARQWLLENGPKDLKARAEEIRHFTSNQFLSAFGEPTSIEASIGRIYEEEGLEAAFTYLEREILPLYVKQRQKRSGSRHH